MLERSTLAENALECLHNEAYDAPYDVRNLTAETMLFMGGREVASLDGAWFFTIDPFDTGLRQRWYAMGPGSRQEPWDYDPFAGDAVAVPSSWNTLREAWLHYEGSAWYTRLIDAAELDGPGRVFLRIGAANYDCKVFLNGDFLGSHRGGSTPFFVELTGRGRSGANWIGLCVNNARAADRVPMRHMDWFNHGGLHREVSLVRTPEAFIRDFFIRLEPGTDFSRVRASLRVEGADGIAELAIPEAGLRAEIAVADGVGTALLDWKPELWSPEQPRLYDVTLRFGADAVSDRVGFREIRREGAALLLNGKPVYLRGIGVHEDDALTGRVSGEADIRRRLRHARELNANFLRLAHYPHHELAARLADEEGVLLWEEIPVYWAIDFDNPATLSDAENQLRELILRDRNRASVIVWGVGNENADTDARLAFMTRLVETCRALDPTRLVSAACLVNHARLRVEDRLAGLLDVIGLNEYYGWYEERFEDLEAIGRNSAPDRPVVITEFGADARPAPAGPASGLFSEAYQLEVYERQIEALGRLDWVKGVCPWLLYDFRTERRRNVYQQGFNRKGLICEDKTTKKPAFGFLAEAYGRMKAGGGR